MTGDTGLWAETLAITNNSLGRLHLTGATRTGTGISRSHHNKSINCCIGLKKMTTEQTHHFHTQFTQKDWQWFSHDWAIDKQRTDSSNNKEESQEKAINHIATNQIAQAKAIKSAGTQSGSRKITRTATQSKWTKTVNWEARRFAKTMHGATNERPTFHSQVTTRRHSP